MSDKGTDQQRALPTPEQIATAARIAAEANFTVSGWLPRLTCAIVAALAEQAVTDAARIAEVQAENAKLLKLVQRTADLSRLLVEADVEWQLITDCRAEVASHA